MVSAGALLLQSVQFKCEGTMSEAMESPVTS